MPKISSNCKNSSEISSQALWSGIHPHSYPQLPGIDFRGDSAHFCMICEVAFQAKSGAKSGAITTGIVAPSTKPT